MNEVLLKILEIIIYFVIGMVIWLIGEFILTKNKKYNLNKEIDEGNKAAGIMVSGLFIAIAIVMSGAL